MTADQPDVSVLGAEILTELGRGGRTAVYRIRYRGGEYALKVLQRVQHGREAADFRREAAVLAGVDHAGLARVHEVGDVDGRPYLVMDLVDGVPLSEVLRGGPLDEAQVVRVGTELADALAATHRAGLVHRDVKPDNIMIAPDGQARLLDFGLAARAGAAVDDDVAVGTFIYSAPEQTGMLHRPLDGRADLYALGVVLFECLTGAPPFSATDVGELIQMHLSQPPPSVLLSRSGLSPAVAAIVDRLLAKDPDDRYPSANALRAALATGQPDVPAELLIEDPPELFGRSAEAERLAAHWQRALDGVGGAALVEGEPGIGKTLLVRQLTAAVAAGGHPVLTGDSEHDAVIPLAAVREAIEGYVTAAERHGPAAREAAVDRLRSAAAEVGVALSALSPLLSAADAATEPAVSVNDEEEFAERVAALLIGLARHSGGALLHLDDVHLVGPATRRVLHHLAQRLADAPLLLVMTARDDADHAPATQRLADGFRAALDLRLPLGPLNTTAVAALARRRLGSAEPPPGLVQRLGGNPMIVEEYLKAVIDGGLLRPSWGAWLLDEEGMDRVVLPGSVIELVLQRLGELDAATRHVLSAAAVIGLRPTAADVAAVGQVPESEAFAALGRAADAGLLQPSGDGYVFVHDEIRRALLDGLDDADRRRLHQRAGDRLDTADADPHRVYLLAEHYLAGEQWRDPERVFRAAAAAGASAVEQYAFVEASELLRKAAAVAREWSVTPDVEFHLNLGQAAIRVDDHDTALEHLDLALRAERDPLRRARLYGLTAEAHNLRYMVDDALAAIRRGCAELGYRLPRHQAAVAGYMLWSLVVGGLLGLLPSRLRIARGERRERYRMHCHLIGLAAESASVGLRMPLVAMLNVSNLPAIRRLGKGPEYVLRTGCAAFTVAGVGLRGRAAKMFVDVVAVAEQIGDRVLIARARFMRGIALDMLQPPGSGDGGDLRRLAETQGQWLPVLEYASAATFLCQMWLMRGYTDRATEWYQRMTAHTVGDDEQLERIAPFGAQVSALAGRPAEAGARLATARRRNDARPNDNPERILLALAQLHVAVELNAVEDFDEVLPRAIAVLRQYGITPRMSWGYFQQTWVLQAFGRLAQVETAPAEQRADRLAVAARAVTDLRRAVRVPLMAAYHEVAAATLRHLRGDHRGALRRLGRMPERYVGLDAPLVEFEAARLRARVRRALHDAPGAQRDAETAAMLAQRHDWPHRLRQLRAEFGVDLTGGAMSRSSSAGSLATGSSTAVRERRFQALHQVSVASAEVLEPRRLAQLALGEIVRIFGAERAFLFLTEDDGDQLRPFLGRDASGADLEELTGYGSSLVERVRTTGEPVVVTGSAEGVALGSQSTVVHGLRSIMVAPLQLRGHLRGVVYLDSRAVRGIFTGDDVQLLAAITNQVALSIETARAAQLELAVKAVERERDVAQLLHQAMAEFSATFDPAEVGRRLVATARRVLRADAGLLVWRQADGTVTVFHDDDDEHAVEPSQAEALLAVAGPQAGSGADRPSWVPALFGADLRTGLAVPFGLRGERRGVLLAVAEEDRRFSSAETEIVAALAGQAAVALENASLFRRVEDQAIRDGLTGLFNRRHFFELAGHYLTTSVRYSRPLTAVMIDIDKFKQVNDTYGHAVGDEVIQQVARRLAGTMRNSDILCRYGGEEFAILMPETSQEQALLAGNRLLAVIADQPLTTQVGPLPITVSVGVAGDRDGALDLDLAMLLKRADEALYEAKRAGRNQVAYFADPD